MPKDSQNICDELKSTVVCRDHYDYFGHRARVNAYLRFPLNHSINVHRFPKNDENSEKSAPEPIEIRDEGDDLAESDVVYVTDKIKSARVDEIDSTKNMACKEEKVLVHSNRDWIVIGR